MQSNSGSTLERHLRISEKFCPTGAEVVTYESYICCLPSYCNCRIAGIVQRQIMRLTITQRTGGTHGPTAVGCCRMVLAGTKVNKWENTTRLGPILLTSCDLAVMHAALLDYREGNIMNLAVRFQRLRLSTELPLTESHRLWGFERGRTA